MLHSTNCLAHEYVACAGPVDVGHTGVQLRMCGSLSWEPSHTAKSHMTTTRA
jgi:hypothetical protein